MKSKFLYIDRPEHTVPIKKAFGAKIVFFYKKIDESSMELEIRGGRGCYIDLNSSLLMLYFFINLCN